jgi:hypothetical protein
MRKVDRRISVGIQSRRLEFRFALRDARIGADPAQSPFCRIAKGNVEMRFTERRKKLARESCGTLLYRSGIMIARSHNVAPPQRS